MARPIKKATDRRKTRSYRATDEEQKIMQENAKAHGMSLSEYIRFKTLGNKFTG